MGKIGHQFMVNSKYIDVHCSILPISLFKIFYNKNIFEKKKVIISTSPCHVS